MDVVSLTEKLVSLPSSQSSKGLVGNFEADTEQFIFNTLREKLSNQWKIRRQKVVNDRYNLIVDDGTPTQLLLIGHMDVVEPGEAWSKNILGESVGNLLYGRGSADMKSGDAIIMTTLMYAASQNIPGVAALFYCDEEYEFLGMKKYINNTPKPEFLKLVVCPEPTDMKIRQGVRGCFECKLIIRGKRGHSARPNSGVNAYRALAVAINAVDNLCKEKNNTVFGVPTVNVAGLSCGTIKGTDYSGNKIIEHTGNVIPDYCEATLELRITPEIAQEEIENTLRTAIQSTNASLTLLETSFFVGSYLTKKEDLNLLEAAQKIIRGDIQYDNPANGGYSDIQMISEKWQIPCALFGPTGTNMHSADESVDIKSLKKTESIFHKLVDQLRISS
jgi:succinyl-diaminopimelate desuccinylase